MYNFSHVTDLWLSKVTEKSYDSLLYITEKSQIIPVSVQSTANEQISFPGW